VFIIVQVADLCYNPGPIVSLLNVAGLFLTPENTESIEESKKSLRTWVLCFERLTQSSPDSRWTTGLWGIPFGVEEPFGGYWDTCCNTRAKDSNDHAPFTRMRGQV